VKRSGRDEPVGAAIHMWMEAMLGISVNIFISNYKKHYAFVIIFYVSFAIKSGWNRFCPEAGKEGEIAKTMCKHVRIKTVI
jgi:hypothetical protein